MFNKEEEKGDKRPASKREGKLIAKKDFHIVHNKDDIIIKKGDVVDVPKKFLQNLKTEGVI